jgi:hypothetical protein
MAAAAVVRPHTQRIVLVFMLVLRNKGLPAGD